MSVVWNLLSAPAAVVFGDQFNTTTSVNFTAGGTYLFRLDASDTDLLGNDTVTVVEDDGNVAPVPNAGADQNILLPTNTVTLTGSATDDGLPSGSVLTYEWTTASGPALAAFQSPSAPTTVVTFEQAGTYVLRLTVGDGLLNVSDEVTVVVDTTPPGPAPLVAILSPTERATITDFTDVVGTVTSSDLLSWRLEAREVGATEFVRIATDTVEVTAATLGQFDPTLAMNGLYELRLTATDNAGQTVGRECVRRRQGKPQDRPLHGVVRRPRSARVRASDPDHSNLRQPRQEARRLRLRQADGSDDDRGGREHYSRPVMVRRANVWRTRLVLRPSDQTRRRDRHHARRRGLRVRTRLQPRMRARAGPTDGTISFRPSSRNQRYPRAC